MLARRPPNSRSFYYRRNIIVRSGSHYLPIRHASALVKNDESRFRLARAFIKLIERPKANQKGRRVLLFMQLCIRIYLQGYLRDTMALRATWTFFARRLIIVHIDRSAECATVPNVEQQLCLHKGQVVCLRFDRNSEHVALNLWTEDREISAMENARGCGRAYLIFYGLNGAL